jgi:hypothetical protein
MISPYATQPAAPSAPVSQTQAQSKEKPAASKATPPATDSVHLSSTALAALTTKPAEASETFQQTLQEANVGDPQALAMLGKK